MSGTVYVLDFTREYPDRDDTELRIGIYASEAEAHAAIRSLADMPGFRDFPQGFAVHAKVLNRTGWSAGFISKVGPPPKDAAGEVFDLPAWIDDQIART